MTLAPLMASKLFYRVGRTNRDALTAKELEVLELLAGGIGNREIAGELDVSEATVKTHLVHIFAKLDVDTPTAAVAVAVERGLIRLG